MSFVCHVFVVKFLLGMDKNVEECDKSFFIHLELRS